jgi:hypothetical protein
MNNIHKYMEFKITEGENNNVKYLHLAEFWISYTATTGVLSTIQILPYYDIRFYIILIFHNFSKHTYKLSEDDADAQKYIGAFVT